MAQPYLDELLAIVDGLSQSRYITCKHFFSGAAAYAQGKIFMSLTPAGLALKLPPEDCDALFARGAKPLRYFPKAPVKRDYAVLPGHIAGDEDAFDNWAPRSIAFVSGK